MGPASVTFTGFVAFKNPASKDNQKDQNRACMTSIDQQKIVINNFFATPEKPQWK
jgi:hypothetical protein